MATFVEGRSLISEAEPVGLLTEGAAGIAVIVLAVIGLAGVSAAALAAIAAIVIGVGLMVQGFNTAAETARLAAAGAAGVGDTAGEMMIDCLAGGTGIVLGILSLIGLPPNPLLPAALIVFGAALLLSGALALQGPTVAPSAAAGGGTVTYRGAAATGGMEILMGLAALVLGILALVLPGAGVLVLVGFITVGAALLVVSAAFSGAVLRIFTGAAP
ncbi:MAG TPA: hypothetical protein VFA12_03925 [Stellaceae bacterium]|jgi:hypothetical protein|nr:hypothetical protein [Stellaceae bacterium]